METSVPEASREGSLALRREAYKALSGRVRVLLLVAIALVSGCLLGYSLRVVTAENEREETVCPARVASPCLLLLPQITYGAPPRLHLLGQTPPEPADGAAAVTEQIQLSQP